MTIGINTSPLSGQDGKKLTARLVENRLRQELVGNVSLRVLPTERPDTWEVQGRGELQLAVLVETMRREGFELTVGKPQVVTREIDGKLHEPVERLSVDVPRTTSASCRSSSRCARAAWSRWSTTAPAGCGSTTACRRVGSSGSAPSSSPRRAAPACCTTCSTGTRRGSASCAPVRRVRSSPTAAGSRRPTRLMNLQDRGSMLVGPGVECYEGMIVGENARPDEMDVNPTKEKKLTNVRAAGSDDLVRLVPPRLMSLEQALEFIADDECVEVTPKNVRLRKVIFSASERAVKRKAGR